MLVLAEAVCKQEELLPLIGVIKAVLLVIQIIIPIGLIVFGTIDLGKAVVASDEKKIKENQMTLIKRSIAAVLVFLLVTIVTFAVGFLGGDAWKACWDKSGNCSKVDPITGKCAD